MWWGSPARPGRRAGLPRDGHNWPVGVEHETGLTVAAVARRMGVAPATLRTWDRRYGVGPSAHQAGTHRRYSPTDLARLEHMRRLVIEGVTPAEAARAAHGQAPGDPCRAGGGRVLAQPGAAPAERGLARAAQAVDTAACMAIISDAIALNGVVWTWDRLLVPVLGAIGDQWSDTGRGVEVEHALSSAVQAAFISSIAGLTEPVNTRTVLLVCAPDDVHTLPLWAVAAALAEHGICSRVLGPGLPLVALVDAVERLGPAAVFVWSQVPGSADCSILDGLPAHRPRASILIGGAGWSGQPPPGVSRVADLSDAVARLAFAVGE